MFIYLNEMQLMALVKPSVQLHRRPIYVKKYFSDLDEMPL
jgi:hypothetical protein